MHKKLNKFWTIFWITLALVSNAENAYAYLDLGSGNYLIQMIVAGFMTMIFALKMYFQRVVSFIKKLFKSDKQ